MSTARLERLIWVLVFAGLLIAGLGIAVLQQGVGWGVAVLAAGAVLTLAGVVLIWVRSRRDPAPAAKAKER